MAAQVDPKQLESVDGFFKLINTVASDQSYICLKDLISENAELRRRIQDQNITNEENARTLGRLDLRLQTETKALIAANAALKDAHDENKTLKVNLAATQAKVAEKVKELEQSAKNITASQIKLKDQINLTNTFKESANSKDFERKAAVAALDRANQELQATRDELQSVTDNLAEHEQFAWNMKSTSKDDVENRLKEIFTAVKDVAKTYFAGDLPEAVLENTAYWDRIRSHKAIGRIPLPASNSAAAKHMRISACVALFAYAFHQHVFLSSYLLESGGELSDVMFELAEEDAPRETYLRRVLLATLPEQHNENVKVCIEDVVSEMDRNLGSLLFEGQKKSFKNAVGEACKLVVEHWRFIQQLSDKVEAMMKPSASPVEHWTTVSLPSQTSKDQRVQNNGNGANANGGSTTPTHEALQLKLELNNAVATVWPSFVLVREGEDELLAKGYILLESQVKIAKEEESGEVVVGSKRAQRQLARQDSRKRRAGSVSLNGGTNKNGFLLLKDGDGSRAG
ncbi:uncharacterized protein BCR38DRAFT_510418 [Pseudomassariella vexata]|uniref:MEI5 protein n=1 Tax=Pseudomassariella vexata TaxID=1141098 RepID=A0A1Y2E7R5_9PEZI|nr:uncharacterized protein BCR38DRAFT_510418 [Pseudomassariella vexata]ORY67477.1 hypothetical protein BCR38DRAFT_510418 [Pseudomassariella vexata]